MNPPQDVTWRRNRAVMAAMIFVVFTGFAFVLPFMPLFVRQLGVHDEASVALWAGVLIGVAPLTAGLLAPVWGRLGDRYGQKAMLVRALLAYAVLLVLTSRADGVGELLALRVGVGLFGGVGPLALAMASAQAPPGQTGRALGTVQAAQILAAAVGPFIGGVLAHAIGIRSTFVVTAGLCLLALGLVVGFYREAPRPEPSAAAARGPSVPPWRDGLLLPLMAALFLVNFVARSFTPILPLYIQGLGVDPERLAVTTGLLISVYSVAAALSASVLGRAAGRVSPRRLLAGSLFAGAVTIFAMSVVASYGELLVWGVLGGLASGGALTLGYTLGSTSVPRARRGAAFGWLSGAALFGGAISPTIAGWLARWDLRGIFYLDTALYVLLAGALLLLRDPAPEEAAETAASRDA